LKSILVLCGAFLVANCQLTQYVEPNSVKCEGKGMTFVFSNDPAKSDLWLETQLNIKLLTNGEEVVPPDFDKATRTVSLTYAKTQYKMKVQTVYGPNKLPLMYHVEQPFVAQPVPDPGDPTKKLRNYIFTVYCTIPAGTKLDTGAPSTDPGHGDPGDGIVKPEEHVNVEVEGKKEGGNVFGDKLTYKIGVKDLYSDMLPVNCKYENAQNLAQNVPFVTDGCPRKFPEEKDSYFGKMARTEQGKYELPFKAFSFDYSKDSFLQISCEVLLCLEQNAGPCSKPCWGPASPPDPPADDPGNPPGGDPPAGEPEADPGNPPDGGPPEGNGLQNRNARPVLARIKFDLVNGMAGNGYPDSMTHKTILNVFKAGSPGPSSSRLCDDVQLLTALYGVIGALAVLLLVMLVTLIYLLYIARRRKAIQDTILTADRVHPYHLHH